MFGPKPHSYDFKLNKKVKDLAKWSALSYKVKNNALVVVEDFKFESPKTKQVADEYNCFIFSIPPGSVLSIVPKYSILGCSKYF